MSTTPLWRFDPFSLDPATGSLWRDETLVPLRPKPFALLSYLVAHAGEVVTKETLLEAVWPEIVVSEGILKDYINQIRKTLGDTPQKPRYIATVHRRGYRFVAPVTSLEGEPAQPAESLSTPTPAETVASRPSASFRPPGLVAAREAELAQLQQWWALAQQGRRQLVLIAGEAGIGKTTLVDAFAAELGVDTAIWIGYGQCIEQYGIGEPYLPLLEALARLINTSRSASLLEVLRQFAPSWLHQLPGLDPTAAHTDLSRSESTKAGMLRELAEAVEVLTTVHPVVIILEDLHWSDTATLDWLSYVARRWEPARLLILGTYRPVDVLIREHALRPIALELRLHQQCQELLLDYWSPVGVATYLSQRFAGKPYPQELVSLLHQRTDGSPLFLVTMVDDVIRRGILQEGSSGVELTRGIEAVATDMPESLRHLIEQQLEQLDPTDQGLLETASVAGMAYSTATLAAGMGTDVVEVEQRCAALARQQQFVQACGMAAWPDGTLAAQYGFRHALYQEVLYERVPVARLSQLHRQIGLRLEAGHGTRAAEIAAELAMHFGQGRETQRAVEYLRQAARNALHHSAHREAVQYLERALQAVQHLPEADETHTQAIDLHLELRNALIPLGQFDRILEQIQAAEALSRAMADQPRLGLITAYMTHHCFMIGEQDQAITHGERALAVAGDDFTVQIPTQLYLGYAYHALGDYPRALEVLRKNMAVLAGAWQYEHFGLAPLPIVSSGSRLAICCAEVGEFPQGLAYGQEALRIAEVAGHTISLIQACRGLGVLYLHKGNCAEAIPFLERGLALSRGAGLPLGLPVATSSLGSAYARLGRLMPALPLLEQAVEQASSMPGLVQQSLLLVRLGEGYLLASRHQDALPVAQKALMLARRRNERGVEASALYLLGVLAACEDGSDMVQAEAFYQQAMTLASNLGMRPLLAHCALGLGALYRHMGRPAPAEAALSTARTLFAAMEMTSGETQAKTLLNQLF